MAFKGLGSRIKNARISCGLTQADISNMLRVSASTVGMWEQGRREPDLDTIEALANIFNVPMSSLTGQEEVDPPEVMTKKDKARLEAMHENPRLGLLFDRVSNLATEDIDFMEKYVERIMKERDGE